MLPIVQTLIMVWEKIVEPTVMEQDEGQRYRLRTFTMLFLVSALMTTAIFLAYSVRSFADPTVTRHAISLFVTCLILYSAVWLTRRGNLQLPLLLLCLYGAPANFALVVMRNQQVSLHLYDYLALITVIGGFFLPRRAMIAAFVYNALWMLATPLLAPEISISNILEGPFLFNTMMMAISLVGIRLFQGAEKRRSTVLERERLFYKSLFEQSNDAIFLLTLEGRNFAANHRAEELLGYSIQEMVNKEVADAVVTREREESERRRQSLMRGDTFAPYERTFYHKDGSEILAEVNVALIRDEHGNPLHFQSIVRDLRDRKRLQAERLHLARAEERISTIREFVSAISHDFRTMLAQIEMGAHLARRALDKGSTEMVQEKLHTISGGVQHMGEQLGNLGTVASLMTLTPVPCDVNGVIQGLITTLSISADEMNIHISFHPAPELAPIQMDVDKVYDAVKHLIRNALTHSNPQGRIDVFTQARVGYAVIAVKDHGKGIAEAELTNLFQPLYRSDFARTVDEGGIGLGLTIVKLVAEAHGGRIEVESKPEEGSIFRMLLPASSN
jgi:PAS domain S-box-containing protein